MRKLLVMFWLCGLFFIRPAEAQFYYYNNRYYENDVVVELGGGLGVMNALTDLGGKEGIGKRFIKDLNWNNFKPSVNVYVMAMFRNAVGLRLEGTFGKVTAYDSILKDVRNSTFGRYERNLSFRSYINDFQLAVEIHPLFFKNYDEGEAPYFSPYVVGGIGYFFFNPEAKLNGQWYALQPLRTEGQGFNTQFETSSYELSQLNFSAGIGVKYEINSFLNARFEINHRFLTTDYLDDVSTTYIDPALFNIHLPSNQAAIAQQLYSRRAEITPGDIPAPGDQRGDPKDNDAFFTIQLKIGITLGRQQR